MSPRPVWISLTEDREGDPAVSVHVTRDGAMANAREQFRECAEPEELEKALADFDAVDMDEDAEGGCSNGRIWISVKQSWLLQ